MASGPETTTVELDSGEVALVISDEDGTIKARVVAGSDAAPDGTDLAGAPEIALALAKRLLKDPDFQEDVLDWYYAHQDDHEADEDADEDEDR